jgi:hypothetical protein
VFAASAKEIRFSPLFTSSQHFAKCFNAIFNLAGTHLYYVGCLSWLLFVF